MSNQNFFPKNTFKKLDFQQIFVSKKFFDYLLILQSFSIKALLKTIKRLKFELFPTVILRQKVKLQKVRNAEKLDHYEFGN